MDLISVASDLMALGGMFFFGMLWGVRRERLRRDSASHP